MTTEKRQEALTTWDQELAAQAAAAAAQEASTGGGQFFSTRGGRLTFNGNQLPDNQMAVIVLDALLVNAYYSGPFDVDSPQTPECYAFGRDEKEMAPHAQAAKPHCAGCAECPDNQFGSGGRGGRGKACGNTRRLALIPGGTLEPGTGRFTPYTTAEEILQAPLAYLKVPPTSLGAFANYVKTLAGAMKLPPRAVFSKIELVPSVKAPFQLNFQPLGPLEIPSPLWDAVMRRTKEVEALIAFPFQTFSPEAAAPVPGSKPSSGKNRYRDSKRF